MNRKPYLAQLFIQQITDYVDTDRIAEAAQLCERSRSTREKSFGPDHPDVAQSLSALAIGNIQGARSDGSTGESVPEIAIIV